MFMLSSRCSPGVVEFETFVAEVGLAVSTALRGLQRLRGLTETAHDGDAPETHRVPVPEGQTWGHGDKAKAKKKEEKEPALFSAGMSPTLPLSDLDSSPAAALLVHPEQ